MVKLKTYCSKIGSGVTPKGGDRVYGDSGTALIRSQNVYNGTFSKDGLVFVNDEIAEKMKGVEVQIDDILLNITGDSVARCCKVSDFILPARVNQHVSIIRVIKDNLNPRFLMYYLISPYMQTTMLSLSGSGGTRKALTKAMIEEFEIPEIEKTAQDKISKILAGYDDLIENNLCRIELLEESARLLYQEWFVHLRFPGHEHIRVVKGVPEGWAGKTLGDICLDIRDGVLPAELEPETPYIGLEHMPRRSISLIEWGKIDKVTSTKLRYKQGDILFGKIRPYFHKVGIAFTDGVSSSDSIVIRPKADDLKSLVLMTVSSDKFVAEASQTMREGSKMPRADWKLMMKYPVAIPPDGLLESFSKVTTDITDQLRTLSVQIRKLRAARDILLPRLLSEKIRV